MMAKYDRCEICGGQHGVAHRFSPSGNPMGLLCRDCTASITRDIYDKVPDQKKDEDLHLEVDETENLDPYKWEPNDNPYASEDDY